MGENVLKFGTYVRVGNAAEAYELLQKNRNNKIVGGRRHLDAPGFASRGDGD